MGVVGFHETRVQSVGGVVDHPHQMHLSRPAIFQPGMHAGVPLHQFAAAVPARTPRM